MSDERKAWLREQLDKFTECQLFSFGASTGFDIHGDVLDLLDENETLRESMLSISISANMEGSEALVRANLLRICMIANNHLREEQEDG